MLKLTNYHLRAVSSCCAKEVDSKLNLPYVEPAGPDAVRLLGTDGHLALALKVRAKHDLTGPCRIERLNKAPKMIEVEAEVVREVDSQDKSLTKWISELENLMPGDAPEQPARFDPAKLVQIAKAAEILSCKTTIHTRKSKAAIFELSNGTLDSTEAGIAVLMPLHTSIDDLLFEETTKTIDRFKAN